MRRGRGRGEREDGWREQSRRRRREKKRCSFSLSPVFSYLNVNALRVNLRADRLDVNEVWRNRQRSDVGGESYAAKLFDSDFFFFWLVVAASEEDFFFSFSFHASPPSPPLSHRKKRRRKVEPGQRAINPLVGLGENARGVVKECRRRGEHRPFDLGKRRERPAARHSAVDRGAGVGRQHRVLQVEAREKLLAVGDLAEVAVRGQHHALQHLGGGLERALLLEDDLGEDRRPVAVVLGELVGEVLFFFFFFLNLLSLLRKKKNS